MKKKTIGIFITSNPITLINELEAFGQNLFKEFRLEILSPEKIPDGLLRYYNCFLYSQMSKNRILKFVEELIACYKYCRKNEPDLLINFINPNRAGFINALMGKLFRTKVVVVMTGETFKKQKIRIKFGNKFIGYISNKISKLSYQLATNVLTYGPILKNQLINEGIYYDKITTMPEFINFTRFFPVKNSSKYKNNVGIPSDKKVALFVGRLTYLKGADILDRVINSVLSRSDNWFFFLIGDGEYYNLINNRYNKNVEILLKVSPLEIDNYYHASDLLIFTSRAEGLPNAILESLACGIPVISSGVGEIPSFVSNICENVEDFTTKIINGNYNLDLLPEYFYNGCLKRKYITFLKEVME